MDQHRNGQRNMKKPGVVTIKWSEIWASSKTDEPKWSKIEKRV